MFVFKKTIFQEKMWISMLIQFPCEVLLKQMLCKGL